MIQSIPQSSMGGRLGESLSSGLEMLIQAKLEGNLQKQKLDRMESILGGLGSKNQNQGENLEGQEGSSDPSAPAPEISDEQILALSSIDPNMARVLQTQKESHLKQINAKATREFARAKPVLARADERAEEMVNKENSLALMKVAVEEGNLSMFSPDNIAELTGIEGLRTGKGALFISAGKEYFLGSLKRAGARPNQWIEQQIQKMLPKIGRSREANLTVLEALQSELNIEKEYQDILNRLVEEDEKKYGYTKGNIGSRANAELRTFANEEQKRLEVNLKSLDSKFRGKVQMKDPDGRIQLVPSDKVRAAKKAGYEVAQ